LVKQIYSEGQVSDSPLRFSAKRFSLRPYSYHSPANETQTMGKGDRKSKRGKIWRGSFGKKRPKDQGQKKVIQAAAAKPA